MMGLLAGLDERYDKYLMEAEQRTEEVSLTAIRPELILMAKYLHAILLGTLQKEPLELALTQEDLNGFEVWRRVAAEANKRLKARMLVRTEELLHPVFGSVAEWRRR